MWWLVCNGHEFVLCFSTLVKVIEYTHKTLKVQKHNVLSLKIVWIFIVMKLVLIQFIVCASILNMYCYEKGDQAKLTCAFFCEVTP
jgi:phage-related holin